MGVENTLLVLFGAFFLLHGISFAPTYLGRAEILKAVTSMLIGTMGIFLLAHVLWQGCA